MSLSDCVNCWDTPCTCGWDYLSWGSERIARQIEMLGSVLAYKRRSTLPPILSRVSSEERAKIMQNLVK